MCLAWIGLVPRHAHRKSPDEEFAEIDVLLFGSQQQIEVDRVGVRRFWRMNRDSILLFKHDIAVWRDQLHQRAPTHPVRLLLQIEQPHEALLSLVFFPIIESVDAVKAGENAV